MSDAASWLGELATLPPDTEVIPRVTAGGLVRGGWLDAPPFGVTHSSVPVPGPARPLRAEVFTPRSGNGVALVWVHGGSWAGGDATVHLRHAADFAVSGYVAVSATYRLSGEARWPAQLDDVVAVLAWAGSLPGVSRVVVAGSSAGAHLAAMAAYAARADVAAAVLISPIVDLVVARGDEVVGPYVAACFDPDGLPAASPVTWTARPGPPALVVAAGDDAYATEADLTAYAAALRAGGTRADLHVVPDAPHGAELTPPWRAGISAAVRSFLDFAVQAGAATT